MKKPALEIVASAFLINGAARAEDSGAPLPTLYVGSFQPVERTSSGFGPLHALASDLHKIKADGNAAEMLDALVKVLRKRDTWADVLPADAAPLPPTGWLIRGVYYGLDDESGLISVPFLGTSKEPDVEITVTLAECAKDPSVPFAVIGTDAVLKGQGSAASWNPYVVAAKFVVHKVQGRASLDGLADQIAQKILDERAELPIHDVPSP
jgi:hypothetical protein